jgi:hypothetical protein
MSFWDRYLAPGDVRAQRRHLESTLPQPPPPQPNHGLPKAPRLPQADRQRRQHAMLLGGFLFTSLSAMVTRRALIRKGLYKPAVANTAGTATLQQSSAAAESTPPPPPNSGLEAIEALGLATLNVTSLAMLAVGAFMTITDVAEIEDLRDQIRWTMGYDVYAVGETEADREMEEWVAEVLAKKEERGGGTVGALVGLRTGVAEKLRELSEKDKAERARKEQEAQIGVVSQAIREESGKGWFGGWFESKPAYDPSTSGNPYINGTKAFKSPLCARCGQPGHLSAQCLYTPLSQEEQNYLQRLIDADQQQEKQ